MKRVAMKQERHSKVRPSRPGVGEGARSCGLRWLGVCLLFWGVTVGQGAARVEWESKPGEWFRGEEGLRLLGNVLSWQTERGDWPKNTDTFAPNPEGAAVRGTFDNGATTGELRFLARAAEAGLDRAREPFLRGLDHILSAQYPNGGWPQSFPPGSGYARHITFNDGTMIRLMRFLREVAGAAGHGFVDADRRRRCLAAVGRGVECILRCQVMVNGVRTAWCAQHDERTLEPRPARAYELVSLSGGESAEILKFLMTVESPGPAVREAIRAGVAWFRAVEIRGLRETRVDGDKRMVRDEAAPPVWARFYEIGTNKPFFCGRDGVKRYDVGEIEAERRNGYAWYGGWGAGVFAASEAWSKRWP